jgi:hypothetical protein
LHGDGGTWM